MRNGNPPQRVLIGVFILIIGVLSLLNNLNLFDTRDILQFWPVVFIVLGTLKIIQTKNRSDFFVGGALVTAGILMTLNHLGVIQFHMHDWWPMFLILIGFHVIFKQRSHKNISGNCHPGETNPGNENRLDIIGVMSGNKTNNSSQDFRGGEITAIMGGVEVDLRNASIQTEAVLNLWATWGGIVLKIPADWVVVNNGVAIMGGIEDKTVPAMKSDKRLIITGYAIMGGVEIKN